MLCLKLIKYLVGTLCLLLVLSKVLAATPSFDTNAPIQIQSDKASFQQLSQQAAHEGNVVMTQGQNILKADKLTIKKNPSGNLTVITAYGKPASFKGFMQNNPEPVFATAQIIHYYPDKKLILLEGKATLDYQQDKFKGPMLSYQLDKQVVTAAKQQDERPTITIQPRAHQN
ncbi:MAG: lipopolysaccharide transport periplasmic protein LptA [Proteobacteria bacterium]|nr:lipopolysaccharide transport periplasmic protein LptA [Pseudomonadota bacterium]